MKPNFEVMSNAQLKAYALEHRTDEDIEALRVLFNRLKSNSQSIRFELPKTTEEEKEQFELFKQLIEEKKSKNDIE